ncbi:hypothetical protein EB796_021030 [Bugula neritina]|uniref:Uncharacterized protein n=1 Tax=Bugula neritina TaxID=10212 RepID=A0A7J7J374_BUGNE|nr:hypothetical protein EB796_021030 [Bugula neritina]
MLVDGKGLLSHRNVSEAHRWAREPTRILSGRDYIRVHDIRYNLFLTGQLKYRMCYQANIFCPVCPDRCHTIRHILQVYLRTHRPRVQRHNMIFKILQAKLAEVGFDVLWKSHIRSKGGLLKPDLIYWHKDTPDTARIIDVSIISDNVHLAVPYRRT